MAIQLNSDQIDWLRSNPSALTWRDAVAGGVYVGIFDEWLGAEVPWLQHGWRYVIEREQIDGPVKILDMMRLWDTYLVNCVVPDRQGFEFDMARPGMRSLAGTIPTERDEEDYDPIPPRFDAARDAIEAELDQQYQTFLADLTAAMQADSGAGASGTDQLDAETAAFIQQVNQQTIKNAGDKSTMPYAVYSGRLFVGDGHDDAILGWYKKNYVASSIGTVRVKRATFGAGSLEFTGVAGNDRQVVTDAVGEFSDKEVKFA